MWFDDPKWSVNEMIHLSLAPTFLQMDAFLVQLSPMVSFGTYGGKKSRGSQVTLVHLKNGC